MLKVFAYHHRMDPIGLLLDRVAAERPLNRTELRRLKTKVAGATGVGLVRNDALLARYRHEVAHGMRPAEVALERILRLNSIRSHAGLATVTVITEPYACPGRCVYCPTEARAPKSYLTNEPAVMRALRNDYDPFRQVTARLQALEETGHPTDKIELIVKGGTWSFYPEAYQRWFIARCFDAANQFALGSRLARPGLRADRRAGEAGGNRSFPRASSLEPRALEEAQRVNETAAHRIIGLTIETRPDYITLEELRRLRELGVTRVELGVQILNDRVLELIVRDHGTETIRHATALLRAAGFKIAYHIMPNLPGATPEDDRNAFGLLWEEAAYRPDTIKLYPCVVIETAELFEWWKAGRYVPYDDETLVELLIDLKRMVPPYVRIERVIRDIPSTSIQAGCKLTNLREEVLRRMHARGLRCRCLRCRQVREEAGGSYQLVRRDVEASGGTELFLSFEDHATDRVAAFLRLRLPRPFPVSSQPIGQRRIQQKGRDLPGSTRALPDWEVLTGAALIRELHTYGLHLPLHEHAAGAAQHRGFGKQLVAEAERIAAEEGYARLAVIAGVGVRDYYRRLGYEPAETYMIKSITNHQTSITRQ